MNTIQGVSVSLFLNGSESPMQEGKFGYLGRLNEGDVVTIRLVKSAKYNGGHRILLVAKTDRTDPIELQPIAVSGDDTIFSYDVKVLPDRRGQQAIADQNSNCVRLIEMTEQGVVTMTNIAIISQKGDYFLVFQQSYRVQAYLQKQRGFDAVAVPGLFGGGGFPDLVPFVSRYYMKRKDIALPLVSEYRDKPLPDTSGLPDESYVIVMFWSIRRGTGVGIRKDGALIKLYHGNVLVAHQVPVFFSEGNVVKVEGYRRPNSRQSDLQFEGVGIRHAPEMEEALQTAITG